MDDHSITDAELLRALMDNTADHIYFKDAESRFLRINHAQAEWMHLDRPEDAVGKSDFDFFTPEHAQPAFEDEQRIIASGDPVLGKEEKETWPDGRVTWVSTTKMPLRNDRGKIVGTFGISRDITDQKLAQQKAIRYAWRLREVNRQMREELAMARELQEAFLPKRYPTFPAGVSKTNSALRFHHHYQAAELVGGDLFSVHALSNTTGAVFICDVMGHGVRAALITAIIRTLVDEWVPIELDPGMLLSRINRLLRPFLRQEEVLSFATAFYLTIDSVSGVARFASAGHHSPIRLKCRKGDAEALLQNGMPIGPVLALHEHADYVTSEVTLEPEDKILLYTDGLYEIQGPDGEEYGEDRLLDSAVRNMHNSLSVLFTHMMGDISSFAKDRSFNDDVCLVGIDVRHLGQEA